MRRAARLVLVGGVLAVASCLVEGASHRIPATQRKLQTPHGAAHHAKSCDEKYCTHHATATSKHHFKSSNGGAAPTLLAVKEWEGNSNYDMPYTMDYVIDVAVKDKTGDGWGYYSTIVDTGSANLGLAVSTCSSCGLGLSTLVVDYSSTQCIAVLYGDTEADSTYWSGYKSTPALAGFVSDGMSMTTVTSFAAITSASTGDMAFFEGGYTGILGLGYSGIAESYYDCTTEDDMDSDPPLLDALYKDGKIDSNVFQITFCGNLAPMVLGTVDESDYKGTLMYTPTQKLLGEIWGYYLVEVMDFKVGGEDIGVDIDDFNTYGGMMVDSGTTELILPTETYVAFAKYLLEKVDFIDSSFFSDMACLLSEALSFLPDMTFELKDGLTLTLPPKSYLIYYEGCYYWGVSSSSMAIMGNVPLQGLSVVFDREKNMMGFATAVCDYENDITSDNEPVSVTSTSRYTTAIRPSIPASTTSTTMARPSSLTRRWVTTKAQAILQALTELRETGKATTSSTLSSPLPPPPPRSSASTLKRALIAGGISLFAIGLAIIIRRRSWRSDYQPVADLA